MSRELTRKLIKKIQYQHLNRREVVFNEGKLLYLLAFNLVIYSFFIRPLGELGRNFYIILSGEVYILQMRKDSNSPEKAAQASKDPQSSSNNANKKRTQITRKKVFAFNSITNPAQAGNQGSGEGAPSNSQTANNNHNNVSQNNSKKQLDPNNPEDRKLILEQYEAEPDNVFL